MTRSVQKPPSMSSAPVPPSRMSKPLPPLRLSAPVRRERVVPGSRSACRRRQHQVAARPLSLPSPPSLAMPSRVTLTGHSWSLRSSPASEVVPAELVVAAVAAIDGVVPVGPRDAVVAAETVEDVGAGCPAEGVVAVAAGEVLDVGGRCRGGSRCRPRVEPSFGDAVGGDADVRRASRSSWSSRCRRRRHRSSAPVPPSRLSSPAPELRRVVAGARIEGVVAAEARELVVAVAGRQRVGALAGVEVVVACAERRGCRRRRRREPRFERVVAAERSLSESLPCCRCRAACSSPSPPIRVSLPVLPKRESLPVTPTVEPVVAVEARERVVALEALEHVGRRGPGIVSLPWPPVMFSMSEETLSRREPLSSSLEPSLAAPSGVMVTPALWSLLGPRGPQ